MRLRDSLVPMVLAVILTFPGAAAAESPPPAEMRQWIEAMRDDPKGPFRRIRWFCNDGTIQPPEPYACRGHGGGRQHGQWSERTLEIREAGYPIATVFAALPADYFTEANAGPQTLKRVLLERFLIAEDDGWILHQARFYRGAFQQEQEQASASRIVRTLADQSDWLERHYLLLREAVRLLPLTARDGIQEIRGLSSALGREYPGFERLRNKLHMRPEPEDADRVRAFAAEHVDERERQRFHDLATAIEAVFDAARTAATVREFGDDLIAGNAGSERIDKHLQALDAEAAGERLAAAARLMAVLRERLPAMDKASRRVRALRASVALEQLAFVAGRQVLATLAQANRKEQLEWLAIVADALYGAGLLTGRERRSVIDTVAEFEGKQVRLADYRQRLTDLARVPDWAQRRLKYHFGPAVEHMATIEPLSRAFVPDRLRGSPALFYGEVVARLTEDANRIADIEHKFFGRTETRGLRSLNPGLARGVVRTEADRTKDAPPGIYVLAETVAELPPADGLVTASQGNPVSHVQLLAGNLGIPNVVVNDELLDEIRARRGERIVLAASPGGVVRIADDGPQWDEHFADDRTSVTEVPTERLDLSVRAPVAIEDLGAADSGRIVGPKSAQLAELEARFPDRVSPALVVPFGAFKAFLEQPFRPDGPSAREWMERELTVLARLDRGSGARQSRLRGFLRTFREWIRTTDPGSEFRQALRTAMDEVFGEEGRYGVFVRSDTNAEDLPGFTGAGLNRTVPHVVGFEAVVEAIKKAWASPFTARAWGWREVALENPGDVYPAVLVHQSVAVDKSGVLITADTVTNTRDVLTVAVNQGLGGGVDGRPAETLQIDPESGQVRLIASATANEQRLLDPDGGLRTEPASAPERLLEAGEINRLLDLLEALPRPYSKLFRGATPAAALDIEFGFRDGELMLFQVRPYQRAADAADGGYLPMLDRKLRATTDGVVDLRAVPLWEEAS